MAPCIPKTFTAGQNPLVVFEGALEIDNITPPKGRSFLFRVTFHVTHPRLKAIAATGKKPPLHFHPYQAEFFKIISGKVTIEVEGAERVISAESGEVSIEPGPYHRLWPTPGSEENLIFDLSASEAPDVPLIVDQCFFENWYGYQNDVLLHGEKLDIIQVMNMFDAGDSYLALFPRWLPFGRILAQFTGILIGRWFGSLLGYRPFHPEWTTDWLGACEKMEQSIFYKRFADRKAQDVARKRFDNSSSASKSD